MYKDTSPPVFTKLIFWEDRKICKWFNESLVWCDIRYSVKAWLTLCVREASRGGNS